MTVSTENILPVSYDLNGSTASYTIPFKITDATHLLAFILVGSVRTNLSLNTDYTVTGVGNDTSTIILNNPAGTSGKKLILMSAVPYLQLAHFTAGTAFPAPTLEQALDEIVRMIQQQQEEFGRTILQPEGTTARNLIFPIAEANKYLRWSPDGLSLINSDVDVPDIVIPPSPVTILFPLDIGLKTDGSVNNSLLLNQKMAQLSAVGGGTVMIQQLTAGTFHFPDTIVVPSFVTLAFASPHTLGSEASIVIAGSKAPATAALRLVSDATAGATTITCDTAPAGGGSLSSLLEPGQPISITGQLDAFGWPLEQESNTVASVNDGTRTVTLVNALQFSYLLTYPAGDYETANGIPNRGLITPERHAALTADSVNLSNLVTIDPSDASDISVHDWVMLEDNRRTSNVTTYQEIAQILAIGVDGTNVVTLSRKVRRVYLVSQQARLTVLNPALRATVQGAAPGRSTTADSLRFIHFHEIRYAVDCRMIDCEVPNTDSFGARGNAFRLHKSYNSWFENCTCRNALYTAVDGEGNGFVCAYSTSSGFIRPKAAAMRHALQFIASTECSFDDLDTEDCRLTEVDFHGLNSHACGGTIRRVRFASRSAGSVNVAIACGNEAYLDGDHDCWVQGGEVGPFVGNSGVAGIRRYVPSTNFMVSNVRFKDIQKLLVHRDTPGSNLVGTGLTLMDCIVEGCSDTLIDLQGGANGSAARTWSGVIIRGLQASGCFRGILAQQGTDLVLDDVTARAMTVPDTSQRYAVDLSDVTSFVMVECRWRGFNRGIQLLTVPSHLIELTTFADQIDTLLRNDLGGSDGTWVMCSARNFSPTYGTAGGSTFTDLATSNIGTVSVTAHTHPESDVTNLVSDLALKAPLASPALTGNPTAPTQSLGNNSTRIATTAYVDGTALALTVPDGDKGDITVSASGTVWRIDQDVFAQQLYDLRVRQDFATLARNQMQLLFTQLLN